MKRLGFTLLLGGCAMINPKYVQKHRDYKVPEQKANADAEVSPGSLWRDNRAAAALFTDQRALRENDLVVVKVSENANATRSNNTDMSRNTTSQTQLNAFLAAATNLQANGVTGGPSVQGQIGGSSGSGFKADGSASRSEQLTATVPAMVKKVLPNGNLFIEGHRVILVNQEEHHFYISGVVRPIDIDQENSIKSAMIADAEIEFTGQGDLTDNGKKGWFQKYLGWLWPF